MKKLLTFILFTLLLSGLFAAPKVPKGTFKSYLYAETEPYVCLSKDSKNEYSIVALTDMGLKIDYLIRFKCVSLESDYSTHLEIGFNTEQQLDNFIRKLNISKIEKEFDRITNILINENAQVIKQTNSIKYSINGSDIKF